jgi:tetratricopeptide (TPR) repeat protein
MKRAPFIAVVSVLMLLACAAWMVSASVAQDTPEGAPETPVVPQAAAAPTADAPAVAPAEKPTKEELEAFEQFKQRDAEGALKTLKKACKSNPDLTPAHVRLAEFFARANIPAGVLNALEQGVTEFPDDPEAYFVLGELARRDRRVAESCLLLEKAESLVSKVTSEKRKKRLQPQILNSMAQICGMRQDWTGAQKYIKAWLALDPKSTDAMQQLAIVLLRQKGDKSEEAALEQLVKARQTDPKLLSPEAILAQYYWRNDNQEAAKKWMKAALNKDLKDIRVRLLVAQWAWENGELKEAKTQAEYALKLDEALKPTEKNLEQTVSALILRGVIALFQKDFEVAEGFFQEALLKSPSNFAASNNLALALVEQKSEEKQRRAFDYAQTNAQKNQKSSEALATYGWVLYKLGRIDEAEKMLRTAASGNSVSADTAYYLARVLFSKNGNDKAVKQLLENALTYKGPFQNRENAKSLLEELKK